MTLLDVLQSRATQQGPAAAFAFLAEDGREEEATSFGQLDQRARALATRLLEHANPGDRVILCYPPGLQFVGAFLGCLAAGLVARGHEVHVEAPSADHRSGGTFIERVEGQPMTVHRIPAWRWKPHDSAPALPCWRDAMSAGALPVITSARSCPDSACRWPT